MGNCKDCKWWFDNWSTYGHEVGVCYRILPEEPIRRTPFATMEANDSSIWVEGGAFFITTHDFGCVLFERRRLSARQQAV